MDWIRIRLCLAAAALAALVVAASAAWAGEDIMPMVPGPYAYARPAEPAEPTEGAKLDLGPLLGLLNRNAPPAATLPPGSPLEKPAQPTLHKNVIKLTLPATGPAREALTEELAAFHPGPRLSPPAAPAAPVVRDAAIPGLVPPESLARDFRQDVRDLVTFDGAAAPQFERHNSAAYATPISTPTYVVPAPAMFAPVDPPPVASPSVPQPHELSLPAPIADAMPPLPYLDPLAQPRRLPTDRFSSKTEALVRVPSASVVRTSVAPPMTPDASAPLSLRPPPRDFAERHDPAPAARPSRPAPEAPTIGGVPTLTATQLKVRPKPANAPEHPAPVPEDTGKTFGPLRSLAGLFGGKK